MRFSTLVMTSFWLLLFAPGCDDKTSSCEAGSTQSCHCPDGSAGSQTCLEGENGWTVCDCGADSSTDPDTDEGDAPYDGPCRNGDDCDDSRADVYPDAPESSCYDELDNGCNGVVATVSMVPPVEIEARAWTWVSQAWTGSEMALFMQDLGEAEFARFSPDGTELGTRVSMTSPDGGFATMAWTGSSHAMAWLDSRELFVTMLDEQGVPTTSDVSLGMSSVGNPSIVWTGSELGVAWPQPCDTLDCVVFTRMTPEGVAIGSTVPVSQGGTDTFDMTDACGLQWTGSSYGVAWKTQEELHLRVISSDTTALGSEHVITGLEQFERRSRCLAWSGSEFAVVWQHGLGGARIQRFEADGVALGSALAPVSDLAGLASPTVSWAGSKWLVVWYHPLADHTGLGGSILDGDGAIEVGPTPFVTERLTVLPTYASAWTGSELVLAWTTYPELVMHWGRAGWCQ